MWLDAHLKLKSRWRGWGSLASQLALAALAFGAMDSLGVAVAGAAEPLKLETYRTHSRLTLQLDEGVASEWRQVPGGFELVLKGIRLGDLGAPLGEEADWVRQFVNVADTRLSGVTLEETPAGLLFRGRWKFATGSKAPARPDMVAFDYRDKESAALVVDFWPKDGATVGEVSRQREAARHLASVRSREETERVRNARRAARLKAKLLSEDPKLFCRTPLSEDTDVFLAFLPFHQPVDLSHWIPTKGPDANYDWQEPTESTPAAQHVRLAIKLYKDKKYGLVNRTLDFLDKDYPGSPFASRMRFLRANSVLKLSLEKTAEAPEGAAGAQGTETPEAKVAAGLMTEAQKQFRDQLADPAMDPEIKLQTALYLAGRSLAAADHMGALEQFMWLAANSPKAVQAWVFHMGAAESARALRQTDRAVKEYEWVAEHGPDARSRSEGALRAGDLYMERFEYDQALASYAQGLRHFGPEAKEFPAVHINRAEALYGLGQFERANGAFKSFLAQFPAHPAGWRATLRLAEIAGRKAGSVRESEEARRWYLETVNRFPLSRGATLARMGLATCGDHGGMDFDAAKRFFSTEAEIYDGAGEVMMERYKDYRALARVRTLMTLGREAEAVGAGIEELRRVSRLETRRLVGGVLAMNFRRTLLGMLDRGQRLEALTFYENNEAAVPRLNAKEANVDPDYLLKLSQAAASMNLGKVAQGLSDEFEKARRLAQAGAGGFSGSGRAPASISGADRRGLDDGNGGEDTEERLESGERHFTAAKALWVGTGLSAEGRIRTELGSVDAESRFSYEREIILGLIEEKHGRTREALRHATRAQLLGAASAKGLRVRDPRVEAWVASLEARAGDARAALAAYRSLEDLKAGPGTDVAEELGVPSVPSSDRLVIAESEILEKLGKWGEAAANYARAVEKGLGGPQAVYGYARALLRTGSRADRSKALAALEGIAAPAPGKNPGGAPVAAAAGAESSNSGAGRSPASEKSPQVPPKGANDGFWRRMASETLANERLRNAKEGMGQ
jgi:tetratricopeptide (TPR) repeat protein